jgi:predicted transcriptional regulator
MKRTQIQLPDQLYDRLKKLARSQETSLSEIIRRAGEYLLAVKPESSENRAAWHLPKPENLGRFLAEESDWRLRANEPNG